MTERVVFWFGVKGAEAVWQPWSEKRKTLWKEKYPEEICPAGSWQRVETGHFLCRAGKDAGLAEIARLLRSKKGMRQALRGLEKDGFCEYLGAGLTLVGLGSEFPTMWKEHGVEGAEFLTLCAYLKRAEFVLPWRKANGLGWLVACPDESTAAAWELALMCVHNVGGVVACQQCGGLFRSIEAKAKPRLCQACKTNKPKRKRVPTERSRFLNLLAQKVKRGMLTDEERKEIKVVLEERGLAAAGEALQEILSGRGIRREKP